MTYKVDNKVYLNSKSIESMRLAKKLNYKYYKLYTSSKTIEKQVYKLELLSNIKIYNIFHVVGTIH